MGGKRRGSEGGEEERRVGNSCLRPWCRGVKVMAERHPGRNNTWSHISHCHCAFVDVDRKSAHNSFGISLGTVRALGSARQHSSLETLGCMQCTDVTKFDSVGGSHVVGQVDM